MPCFATRVRARLILHKLHLEPQPRHPLSNCVQLVARESLSERLERLPQRAYKRLRGPRGALVVDGALPDARSAGPRSAALGADTRGAARTQLGASRGERRGARLRWRWRAQPEPRVLGATSSAAAAARVSARHRRTRGSPDANAAAARALSRVVWPAAAAAATSQVDVDHRWQGLGRRSEARHVLVCRSPAPLDAEHELRRGRARPGRRGNLLEFGRARVAARLALQCRTQV